MSTPQEQIESQKQAYEATSGQPFHRHLMGPVELKVKLDLLEKMTEQRNTYRCVARNASDLYKTMYIEVLKAHKGIRRLKAGRDAALKRLQELEGLNLSHNWFKEAPGEPGWYKWRAGMETPPSVVYVRSQGDFMERLSFSEWIGLESLVCPFKPGILKEGLWQRIELNSPENKTPDDPWWKCPRCLAVNGQTSPYCWQCTENRPSKDSHD